MLFKVTKFEEMLDVNPYLIGLRNGVYDLANKEFRNGQPDDMISMSRGHNFVPRDEAIIKEIMDFIRGIMPSDKMADYIIIVQAYNLSGDKYLEFGCIWVGIGRSGKGTLRDLIKLSSGDYFDEPNIQILTNVSKNPQSASPEWRDLKGKRDVFMLEPEEGEEKIKISLWKKVCGLDNIKSRGLFKKNTNFKPQFMLQVQCNEKMMLSKYEANLEDKIVIIEFPFKHSENPVMDCEHPIDTTLKKRFESNPAYAEQWFNILLEKYYEAKLNENKPIPKPTEVIEATREYLNDNNPFGVWLKDMFYFEPNNKATRISPTDMYAYYCNDNPDNPINMKEFSSQMGRNGYKSKKGTGGVRYYGGFTRNEEKVKEVENRKKELALKEKENVV